MERAKQAVSDFLHKDGRDTTTVHENVKPAIQQEHVTPTRHENVTTAVDKEVHQDHYHTSVQPVKDKEILPEKHTHQVAGTEHRDVHHGHTDNIKQKVAAEAAQFKSTREVGETQHTRTAAPTVAGEHVHHHVHENIQPVVQKETIQPNVVHTTIPIHETHHNEAKHHTASTLPTMTMAEFKKAGGALTGRDERTDAFEGAPKGTIGSVTGSSGHPTIGGHGAQGTTHLTENTRSHAPASGVTGASATKTAPTGGSTTAGPHNSNLANKADPRVDSDRDGSSNAGFATVGTAGSAPGQRSHQGSNIDKTKPSADHARTDSGHTTTTTTTTTHKPSLLDKLNPRVDADGDGKSGFMK